MAWCPGKVTEIIGGVSSVVFLYPNEPPDAVPVAKLLPLGDKGIRLRGIDAAYLMSQKLVDDFIRKGQKYFCDKG